MKRLASIDLPDALGEALEAHKKQTGVPHVETVRRALAAYLYGEPKRYELVQAPFEPIVFTALKVEKKHD